MVSRRRFILGTAGVLGSLVVGWSVLPPRQRMTPSKPLPASGNEMTLNGWVKLAPDGAVIVMLSKSEMGQGIMTSLAMLLADEMDADWSSVRTEMVPIDAIYNNITVAVDSLPFRADDPSPLKPVADWMTAKLAREIGIMTTGGSSSIKDLWLPMRKAGAAARQMLIAAAAEQWQVPAAECRASSGRVVHPSGRSAAFGELAAAAARQALPDDPPLKDIKDFTLIGKPLARMDAPAKLDGSAVFGIDALPDGLLYASVRMCPALGGTVASFDPAGAMRLAGVRKVLAVDGFHGGTAGVAVIADTPWHADKALDAVRITWNEGSMASISGAHVLDQLSKTLDSEHGRSYYRTGDVESALAGAVKRIEAEYRVPYLAHMTMEPMNCTVQVRDGKAIVWASTQVPTTARHAVAKVLGIAPGQVEIKVLLIGCGLGRRLEVDYIAQAAAIARAAGGPPVQTMWSRGEDTTHDFYRPACISRFRAGFDADSRLVAWWNTSASQSILDQVVERTIGLPWPFRDRTTSEGAFDRPYEWPNARVAHQRVDFPVPVGFWRSVGHSHNAFFTESFIDEAAVAIGRDPVDFRLSLLQNHPRHRAVLERAATLADWRNPPAPTPDGQRKARGIALHESFGSIVAQVVEASLDTDEQIRVHRVVCVIDCGFAVNSNLIRQQMEGGIVFGLSAALHGEIVIENGRVKQRTFDDQNVVRIDTCPQIETEIIPNNEPPAGVGEAGAPPIAPALANALFALTGRRLRSLPLRFKPAPLWSCHAKPAGQR
ncbi:MAG TPA: xanthine dehydrogenase family protein molybdopterin-binding subunit [Aromatoleum sp.]|uniref:xanthine dehydrogenase family protein molybdopterin-binding subunit n=1 Tax=Aromatoleum sp. TaxID=2307007 RepID=UPI002B45FDCE|nr:xanthine dehydrogenase family protein molybdopterin-binding subunit [Aromatoleum sp.]HJV26737.1 xanthine dehydrogenase family protein molybdopterin-binding subunit [Aromatoleum sp.]